MSKMLVGTVALNNRVLTKMFLTSLYRTQQEELCDSLVVDNGSTDDILSLQREFKHTRFIRFETHQGVSPAWNTILKQLGYDYYAVMNNDIVLGPHFVELAKAFMDQYPTVGISSPFVNDCRFFEAAEVNERYWLTRRLFQKEEQVLASLQYTYEEYAQGPGPWNGFDEFCDHCETKYQTHEGLPQFLGSGFIMRKEMINEVGMFDEEFCDDKTKVGVSEDFTYHDKLMKHLGADGQPKWLERLDLRNPVLHLSMQTRSRPDITQHYHGLDPAAWEAKRHEHTKLFKGSDLRP